MLFLIFFVLPSPAAFGAERVLLLAPANGRFHFHSEPGQTGGCTMSLQGPTEAVILQETETQFQVQWKKKMHGCYWYTFAKGLDLQKGWVKKEDLVWEEDPATPYQPEAAAPMAVPAPAPRLTLSPEEQALLEECRARHAPELKEAVRGIGTVEDLMLYLKNDMGGIKNPDEIDLYQRCYPYLKNGEANYARYSPFLDLAADVMRLNWGTKFLEVNPSLSRCLIRRESGFDPKNSSGSGYGLGQQTAINVKEISRRLARKGSWEAALWKEFFTRVNKTQAGRAMLADCPGSVKKGQFPVFQSRADSLCPLQSIAASHIYMLQIQLALQKSANVRHINWEKELDYQVSIAAAYNLGDSAASKAVDELIVDQWVDAIQKKSKLPAKRKEVAGHVEAIRSCLEVNNWDPMHGNDSWKCESPPPAKR